MRLRGFVPDAHGDQSGQYLPMPGDADCRTHSQVARRESQSPGRLSLSRAPHVCPRGATRARLPQQLHVNHAMLAPDQIDAMRSQREGQGFESP